MSDKVKLIIEIPKPMYESVQNGTYCGTLYEELKNGIPLDDVKVEIKAIFPPSGNWMYDEDCEYEHTVCEVLVDVLQILDNIGKGDKE